MLIFSFALFGLATVLCFTIPGLAFLKVLKINITDRLDKLTISTILGFTFFTITAYFFLIINLHYLMFIFLALPLVYLFNGKNEAPRANSPRFLSENASFLTLHPWTKSPWFSADENKLKVSHSIPKKVNKKIIFLFIILLLGTIGQLAIIAPSGVIIKDDLVFWSSHGHDGSWHIALMEQIKQGWPLENPVLAGERLVNYHFFSDLAPAFFNLFFQFSLLDLYFRFFPLLYALLFGLSAFILGKRIFQSFEAGIWSMVFTYFAGSFGYIISLARKGNLDGETIFGLSQTQSTIGNPPQIAASIIVLTIIYLLFIWFLKHDWRLFIIIASLIASLAGFKIYAGLVMILSLLVLGVYQIITKRSFHTFFMSIVSGLFSLCIYLPNVANSASFLIWEPWYYIRTMVVAPNMLNWIDLELRRQTYLSEGNIKRVIQLEAEAFLIFLIGNLGLRIFGFYFFLKTVRKISSSHPVHILICIIILTSFILPMIFLQKGVAGNSIQFMQYFLLLMGIVAGGIVATLIYKFKSALLQLFFALTIFLLMVPTQIGLIDGFYSKPPVSKISLTELAALKFLEENTNQSDIILTPPYNKYLENKDQIPSVWVWFDTAYVSAFSKRITYFADFEQVDIMGYNFKTRQEINEEIFSTESKDIFFKQVEKTQANFLYFPKMQKPKIELTNLGIKKIFENDKVEIWKLTGFDPYKNSHTN